MIHIPYRRGVMAFFCGALLLMLAACTATSTVTTGTGTPSGGTPAAGSTPGSATDTPAPAAVTCAALLPGAGTASAGAGFADLHFPSGSVSTGPNVVHSGPGLYTVSTIPACVSGTSAAAVHSFYTTDLAAEGWGAYPTLPFDGAYEQPCGDPYCWKKGASSDTWRLIGLESVADRGNNVVTFQWRIFLPPSAGICNVTDMTTGGVTHGSGGPDEGFQYPPITSYNSFGGAAGSFGFRMCSAGNATTIAAFMKNAIGNGGWHVLSSSATTVNAQMPNPHDPTFCYTLNMVTGGHGSYTGEWDITFHSPAAMCI